MSDDNRQLDELDDEFTRIMGLKQSGDHHQAEEALDHLIKMYQNIDACDREAMCRINLGQLLQQRGDLDGAEQQYDLGVKAASCADDVRRKGMCLGALATISMERGDHSRTEDLLQQALGLFTELGDPVGLGNQYGNLGLHLQSQGRLEEAIDCFQKAAGLFVSVENVGGAVGVLQCMGELHRRQGEYDDAMSAHQQALKLAQAIDNGMAQARSLRAIGQIHRVRGDLEKALEAIQQGMKLHSENHDVRGELAALIDLGTIEFSRGRGTEALKCVSECIERARALDMVTPLTKALLNRSVYRLDTDQPDEVKRDLDEAKTYLERLNDPLGWNVWSVVNARVLIRLCQWDEAERILNEELDRVQTFNIASSLPPILGLLASIDSLRGNTESANERLLASEAHYRALKDVEGARMAVLARARLLAEMGRLDQAITVIDHLLKTTLTASLAQPVLEAEMFSARAGAKNLAERYEEAREDAAEAVVRYREAGFQLAEIGARLLRRHTYTDACRFDGVPLPQDHIDALRRLVESAKPLQAPTLRILTTASLADALALGSDLDEARTLVNWALSEAKRLAFPDGVARSLQVLARVNSDPQLAQKAIAVWLEIGARVRARRLCKEWKLAENVLDESS